MCETFSDNFRHVAIFPFSSYFLKIMVKIAYVLNYAIATMHHRMYISKSMVIGIKLKLCSQGFQPASQIYMISI